MNNNNTIYKDTPLGKIPSDWEVNTLGVLTEKIGSGITPRGGEKVYKLTGRPFLRSQNVGWGTLILDDVVFIDEETHKSFPSTEIKDGDVFLNITGASIGRSAVSIKSVIGGNVNQHVCIIRSDRNLLNPSYLNSFLLSKQGQNLIYSYQAGGNRQGLNFEQIRSFRLPLPPLPEQKVIAHILSLMDAVINKNNQLIAKKELQKKWLMQNLLTGKKRLLNDELGVINYELKQVRFGDFCRVSKGKAISAKDISKGIYPVIAGGQTSPYSHSQFTHENVITVSASGAYAGFVAFHGNKIWASDCSVIEEIENVSNIHYLYYFLKFKQDLIYSLQAGGAQPHVFPKDIYNLSFIIHNSIKEQTAIAQVLKAADKEIQLLKAKTEKLRDQKKGLMQQLLTGKKRLAII